MLSFLILIIGKKSIEKYILCIFLCFHPLLLSTSWQLRMYGIICLPASLSFYFFNKWRVNSSDKYVLLSLMSASIGLFFHYSFLIFAFVILLDLFFKEKKSLKNLGRILSLLLAFIIQFLFLVGMEFKNKFSYISWVPYPSFQNISAFLSSIMGTDISMMNNSNNIYVFLGVLIFFIFTFSFFTDKKNIEKFLLFFVIPVGFGLLFSVTSSFFSTFPVIGRFIPNVSILLPRFYISFLCIFFFLVSSSVNQRFNSFKPFLLSAVVLIFLWGSNMQVVYGTTLFKSYINRTQKTLVEVDSLYWPDWLPILMVNPKNILEQYNEITEARERAKELENNHSLYRTTYSCSQLNKKSVYLAKEIPSIQISLKSKIETTLLTCNCVKKHESELLTTWFCLNQRSF